MKIAVVNETSSADRNADVMAALEGRDHEIVNVGMTKTGAQPSLSYLQTGLLTGLLLNLKRADFVVGGCGTGQGYLLAAMQYPGVFCGAIRNPVDAWLFTQINGGNCISLMFNKDYGWAADINMRFIFDRIFSVEPGSGYPDHRKEPQRIARESLEHVSRIVHPGMARIVEVLPDDVLNPVLTYPGVVETLSIDSLEDRELKEILKERIRRA